MQVAIEGAEAAAGVVDNFLASLKSPRTKEIYDLHRKLFLRFVGRKSINEVNNAAEATGEIVRYLRKLKDDDGSSYSHRHLALAAIKHDYVMHRDDLLINWKKISKFLGENESKNEIRGYTHEEIQRLIDVASDIKYKAVILMLASTGMRRDALVNVELKDMEYLKEPYNLYKIKIYKKSKFEQICFTTPEAADIIKLYLKGRIGGYFHRVDGTSISMTLSNLAAKAGIIERKGTHDFSNSKTKGKDFRNEVPAVHGLRKFCITQMAKAKVDTEIAKLLTGHSIGVRGRYLNYTEDDLLQEYLKAVDLLTINEANRLRKKVSALEQKDREIQALREQIKQFQQEQQEQQEQAQDQMEEMRDEMKEVRQLGGRDKQILELTKRLELYDGEMKAVRDFIDYLKAHPESWIGLDKMALGKTKKGK